MSKRMKQAPVFYTVAQVQHNPLLNLASYLPTIQERMRKAGFPDFKRLIQRQLTLGFQLEGGPAAASQAVPEEVHSFLFSDTPNTSGFVMKPDGLFFHTTAYDTFDVFLSRLRFGLEVLGEAVSGIDFTERIGLRYLDAVTPTENESVKDYLASELLGLPWSIQRRLQDAKFTYSFNEALLVEPAVGQVVCRAIVQSGKIAYPADVTSPLELQDRFKQFEGVYALLDTDASNTSRLPFDIDRLESSFWQLHALIEHAFHGSVTDYARAVWQGEESRS